MIANSKQEHYSKINISFNKSCMSKEFKHNAGSIHEGRKENSVKR